jgi:hypothetical protein
VNINGLLVAVLEVVLELLDKQVVLVVVVGHIQTQHHMDNLLLVVAEEEEVLLDRVKEMVVPES